MAVEVAIVRTKDFNYDSLILDVATFLLFDWENTE